MKSTEKLTSVIVSLSFGTICFGQEATETISKPEASKVAPSPSKSMIQKKGKLSDLRGYEITASITSGSKTPRLLEDLKLFVGGQSVEIPKTAWCDLLVVPEENKFSVSDFAGEITLHIVAQGKSQPCVANLKIRDGHVVEREILEQEREPIVTFYQPPVQYTTATIDAAEVERASEPESQPTTGKK